MNDASADHAWENLSIAHRNYIAARLEFFSAGIDRIASIKQAIKSGNRECAIEVAGILPLQELQQLLPDLVFLASWGHGSVQSVRDLIRKLPRDYVLLHIEDLAEPHLNDEEDEYNSYWRFLELYSQLDKALFRKLITRGELSDNPEIREAARDTLNKLQADEDFI